MRWNRRAILTVHAADGWRHCRVRYSRWHQRRAWTCWLNAHNREQPEGIAPTWTFLRCTNWSSSCVNTDCLPPLMGKIAAIFRFQQARRDAAYQEERIMTLSPYLQEVAKRRILPLFLTRTPVRLPSPRRCCVRTGHSDRRYSKRPWFQPARKSDWMEMEKQRGISITTSVSSFRITIAWLTCSTPRGTKTLGRYLSYPDGGGLLPDGYRRAKGVEDRTRKLMEVTRLRDSRSSPL